MANYEKLYADVVNKPLQSYFPIKIKYSNGDVVIVQHSNELRSGESFTVLAINVKETEK